MISLQWMQLMLFGISINVVDGFLSLNGATTKVTTSGTVIERNLFLPSNNGYHVVTKLHYGSSNIDNDKRKISVSKVEQDVVDEYLEFLDRRYHRFYDDETKKDASSGNGRKFSVLDWLRQSPYKNIKNCHEHKEDALYVLGVAGLASKKLLQKHHMLNAVVDKEKGIVKEEEKEGTSTSVIIDHEEQTKDKLMLHSAANVSSSSSDHELLVQKEKKLSLPLLVSCLFSVIRAVKLQRQCYIRQLNRRINMVFPVLAKSLILSPVLLTKALWKLGGGKQTVPTTAKAATTAIGELRPYVRDVANESLLS